MPTNTSITRCAWVSTDPLYESYHDLEWGTPERDDRALFEKLILDGFQAGLSWITILRKRENFRRAFDGFDPEKIARFTAADRERLNEAMPRRAGDLSSPLLTDGTEYRVVVPALTSGTYQFFCLPHKAYDMRGEVSVR